MPVPEGYRRINFNCPDELYSRLLARVEKHGVHRTLSKALVELVTKYVESRPQTPPLDRIEDIPEDVRILLGLEGASAPQEQAEQEEEALSPRLM